MVATCSYLLPSSAPCRRASAVRMPMMQRNAEGSLLTADRLSIDGWDTQHDEARGPMFVCSIPPKKMYSRGESETALGGAKRRRLDAATGPQLEHLYLRCEVVAKTEEQGSGWYRPAHKLGQRSERLIDTPIYHGDRAEHLRLRVHRRDGSIYRWV